MKIKRYVIIRTPDSTTPTVEPGNYGPDKEPQVRLRIEHLRQNSTDKFELGIILED